MTHLDRSALLEAAAGTPSSTARRHLARCAVCRRRVAALRERLDGLREAALPEPPPALGRWALAVARNSRAVPETVRTLALLHAGEGAGVRGAADRSWLLGDPGCQLDLRAERTASGRIRLSGHLVREEGGTRGWRVRLEPEEGEGRATFTDPWGEFVLEEVPAGRYGLVLVGDGERLETAGLELG